MGRTLYTLAWLEDPTLRRRVTAGLNKGEARNSLARAVFFNRLGEIRDRSFENQRHRASYRPALKRRATLDDFAHHASRLGGTVSAEHGLGKRKVKLLPLQYAPEHIQAMKDVNLRLHPKWLLGRGTLFPTSLLVA
jgi:hypothetical protein